MASGPDVGGGNPLTWLFTTAIRGIRGDRPLGDITPGGVDIFGNFFRDVLNAQQAQNAAAPVLTQQPLPGQSGSVLDDLLKRPGKIGTRDPNILDELLKRPSTAGQGDINRGPVVRAGAGSLAAILARGAGLLGGLLYVDPNPKGVKSDRRDEFPDPKKGPIQPPPNQPSKGPRTRPVIGRPVVAPPPTAPLPALPETRPRTPSPVLRPSVPSAPPREIPSRPTSPMPSPASGSRPASAPFPTASPATGPKSAPLPRLFAFPMLAPFLFANPNTNRSVRNQPGQSIEPVYRFSEPIGLTRIRPGGLRSPLTSPSPSSSSDNCSCAKPARNRKPRKPRDVCYKGEYIERANGITKFKRRKIKCQ